MLREEMDVMEYAVTMETIELDNIESEETLYIPTYLNRYYEREPMTDLTDIIKWNEVNNFILKLDEETVDKYTEIISDFVWSYGKERRKAYNRIYRLSKKINFSISDLEMWYCCE